MAQRTSSAGAKAAAILGLLLSLPVLTLAWIIALGAMTYGVPSGEGQMAVPLGRELSIWGLAEAVIGTLCLVGGAAEWAAGRRASATWLLWGPILLLIAALIALAGFVVYLQATGPHR